MGDVTNPTNSGKEMSKEEKEFYSKCKWNPDVYNTIKLLQTNSDPPSYKIDLKIIMLVLK